MKKYSRLPRLANFLALAGLLAGMLGSAAPVRAAASIGILAGNGTDGPLINDIPATDAQLWGPSDVAVTSDGTVFIADTFHHQIRKVGADGIIRAALGTGTPGCDPAGGNMLVQPRGITTDASDNIYVSNTLCGIVERVDTTGAVTVVAGHYDPNAFYTSNIVDGMPATQAFLSQPAGLDYDDTTGSLYIADQYSQRILKVTNGAISVVAGTINNGYAGDGGPATSAQLNYPNSVLSAGGNLYIADASNCRVRVVDATGIIRTLIGNGSCSNTGDGGPAALAGISGPADMVMDPSGNLILSSTSLRKITPDGTVTSDAEVLGGYGGLALDPSYNLIATGGGAGHQYVYKVSGVAVPPVTDGKQHGRVNSVSWTVTPTTALWNIDVTVTTSGVSCQTTGATLVITVGTWTKRPTLCAADGSAPATFNFSWKVFNKNQSLPPGTAVPITAYVAKSDAPHYGGPTTQLTVPFQPTLIGVGDSYLSGHHQTSDEPLCAIPPSSALCAPSTFVANDPAFSWVTRLAAKLNTNVPTQWQLAYDTNHLLARSGATTQQMVDSQSYDMIQLLQGHSNSWNIVALSGGANDADFASALTAFYNAHTPQNLIFPLAPWAVKTWSDCPNTEAVYNRALGQQAAITANLRELMQRARDASNGAVRFVDMLYPYTLKADNVCNVDTPLVNPDDPSSALTWHGAKSTVDTLDAMHLSVDSGYNDVTVVDLRTNFNANPLLLIQQTRNYGYPHPNDSGQDKISKVSNQLLKQ